MGWIISLLLLGVLLFLVELILLPGISIAGVGALACFAGAVTMAFTIFSTATGFMYLGIAIVLIVICMIFFLRAKTWRKVALDTEVPDSIAPAISELVPLNTVVTALTRLAPMGKVLYQGETYEAKSLDIFIDQRTDVVVKAYDNQVLVVEAVKLTS